MRDYNIMNKTIVERKSHIDLIETIAIFLVIVYHSTLYSFDFLKESSTGNYIAYFFNTILSPCVPLFFLVNGYLLLTRPFSLKKHIKKIFKLIALAIFWGVSLTTIYMVSKGKGISIGKILKAFLQLDSTYYMPFLWFIGALVSIYILFPALKALFDSNQKAFVFCTIAIAIPTFGFVFVNQLFDIFSGIVGKQIKGLDYPAVNNISPVGVNGYAFVYFMVGGLLAKKEIDIKSIPVLKRNIISILGIIISCGCLFLFGVAISKNGNDGQVYDVVYNAYNSIFTFFNVVFIYLLCLNYQGHLKFIKNVSLNTLGIYFIHGLLLWYSRPFLSEIEFLCNIPFNLAYAFSVLCICLLICMIMKKIPLIRNLI